MSKKGSKGPKETPENKDSQGSGILNIRTAILLGLVLIVGGYFLWDTYISDTTDTGNEQLSDEELEFQRIVDESIKAPTAEEIRQQVAEKESELEGVQPEQSTPEDYYELAELYYVQGDFDKFFTTIEIAEDRAEELNNEDMQEKIEELKKKAEREYELLESYL